MLSKQNKITSSKLFLTVFVLSEVFGGAWWGDPTPPKEQWIHQNNFWICILNILSWAAPV